MSLLCDAFDSVDSICVNTGEVIVSKKYLSTSFVNTCSVLVFQYGDMKFMAHIDAINPNMETIINLKLKSIDFDKIRTIFIWKGTKCVDNCPSFNLAKKVLAKIGGNKEIVYLKSDHEIIRI
uniref:Uncharacterized protein n=1 Tax=viral metagenome TaxID=1070528 RepID=A0A6C0F807_9ZZZZ|tara:strand:- start:622 stop:987 length:366 start_codon:yes stop_codon:yes gene_type:complete